jgi:cold shock CspA family protein
MNGGHVRGKVVSYISQKKYGFITGEDDESYFLHSSSLLDKANEKKIT